MTTQKKYDVVKEFGDSFIHSTDFFCTFLNPSLNKVILVVPKDFEASEIKSKIMDLQSKGINEVNIVVEEFPKHGTGWFLVSKGIKAPDLTTTTEDPIIKNYIDKLTPVQTKFPCGNFRPNPDNPTSIVGSRPNGSYYEIHCPPDMRDNIMFALQQVNYLLERYK